MPNRSHKEELVRWLCDFGKDPTEARASAVIEGIYALFPEVPRRKRSPNLGYSGASAEMRDRICEAYELGGTQEAIARAAGLTQSRVSTVLRKRRVQRSSDTVVLRTSFNVKRSAKKPLRVVDGHPQRCCGQCEQYFTLDQFYGAHQICKSCQVRIQRVAAVLKRLDELRQTIEAIEQSKRAEDEDG